MTAELQRIRTLEGEAMDKDARNQRLEGLVRWIYSNLRRQHPLPDGLRRTMHEVEAEMAALGVDIVVRDGCGANVQRAGAVEGAAPATHPVQA